MESSLLLTITTIGNIASSLMLLALTVFVLLNNPKRLVNQLFSLGAFFVTFFGFFFATAINLEPSKLAYSVWMLSIIDVGMVVFFFHLGFVLIGTQDKAKWLIRSTYAIGALIVALALIFPHLFITEVVPKQFTKSYPSAGPLFTIMFLYFNYALGALLVTLIRGYKKIPKESRGQIEYFALTIYSGFGFGSTGFAVVYDLPVNPMFVMFFGVCLIPFAYGIVAKEMLDIRIAFKKALIYSATIGLITAFFIFVISLNDYLASHVSWFRWWTTPVITALAAFIVGQLYWKKAVENERLKYEFVTVVAHKLRTPLTQISWGVRELLDTTQDQTVKASAEHIQRSADRLIELSNLIVETTTSSATSDASYSIENIDLAHLAEEVHDQLKQITNKKNVSINFEGTNTPSIVRADERRVRSVIEVMLENALSYTPENGSIVVRIERKKNTVTFSVKDSGMGISAADKKLLFSRFFRSDAAKRADTEGVGLGLAMAKNIIERHKGKIGVESEGEGKGATFWFTLPTP